MGKKNGKKLGNDDRFFIFYNFCCNFTFYMRSKYVGGMVWQFCIPRAHAKYVHPKGTNAQFSDLVAFWHFFIELLEMVEYSRMCSWRKLLWKGVLELLEMVEYSFFEFDIIISCADTKFEHPRRVRTSFKRSH